MALMFAQGFLPTRGSYVLDAVFVAMFVISIVLLVSILLARQGKYELHRKIQIALSGILLAAILVFEFDVRFVTDWRSQAAVSPYYESGAVNAALIIHLLFAIPTPAVWIFVLFRALKRFSRPAAPSAHSHSHRFWGWIAASMMWATSITGCTFYWLAFVSI
jgi:putative membrane protein